MFEESEIATIRKFFAWIKDGEWLSCDEAIVGISDDGILLTEFNAVSDYDSYTLERTESFIPWIALTDPDEYQRQCEREAREREAHYEAQRRAQAAATEARQRATYEALKAKYEPAERAR